jgi:hypothetical protein
MRRNITREDLKMKRTSIVRTLVGTLALTLLSLGSSIAAHAAIPNMTNHTLFISHTPAHNYDAYLTITRRTADGTFVGTLMQNGLSYSANITITEPNAGYYQMTVTVSTSFLSSTTYQGALSVNGSYSDFFTGTRSYSGYTYSLTGNLSWYSNGPLPFCATGGTSLK